MAEIDGNTVPAAQPSDVRRPMIHTPSELLPLVNIVLSFSDKVCNRF